MENSQLKAPTNFSGKDNKFHSLSQKTIFLKNESKFM